jgi:hypothetical protein
MAECILSSSLVESCVDFQGDFQKHKCQAHEYWVAPAASGVLLPLNRTRHQMSTAGETAPRGNSSQPVYMFRLPAIDDDDDDDDDDGYALV